MSIAEQITKSAQNLSNSRKAILLKGGNVGDNPAFNNLASEIESIPSGDANYVLVDDTDTAYRKSILAGASPIAKLKSIGGMTYKRQKIGENLLPSSGTVTTTKTGGGYVYLYPSLVDDTTGAIELEAGEYIITLNLTADAPIYANFIGVTSINGDYANGDRVGTDEYKFTLSEKTTVTSLTCDYELVTDAETITVTYTPSLIKVGYELVDSKVTEIINHGANLFDIYRTDFAASSTNAMVYKPKVENGIFYSGGKLDESQGATIPIYLKPNTDYTFSCNVSSNDANIYLLALLIKDVDGYLFNLDVAQTILAVRNNGNATVAFNSGKYTAFGFVAYSTNQYGMAITDIQLNLGTTAALYKPYREPITYTIPEALQGSGKGIEGYADTADFERGKDIKRCETYVFTGNEIWSDGGNGRIFISDDNSPLKKPCVADKAICNQYDLVPYASIVSAPFGSFCIREGGGVQFKTHHEDHEKWRAYLSEQYANGNPVTLTYALAEPIETDLPETFSNLIEVEGGGSLEFVNEYSNAVPSHISYLRRIV